MTTNTVVVAGGGVGGIDRPRPAPALGARRSRRAGRVQPALPLRPVVPLGDERLAPAGQITADVRGLRRHGIEVVEASVEGIDPERRRVETSAGDIPYDRFVVALGAELAPASLPGFAEAAHNLYTLDGAESANRALGDLARGRVAILVSGLPYKCPAAPYEAAFLAEALLRRRRGVRSQVAIDVYTPEALPLPTAGADVGRAIAAMLEARGIGFHAGRVIERIEGPARRLTFRDGAQADYDLLIGVPPHRAPAALAEGGLAGPSGFVPVDRHSLATAIDGTYAIGDATQIPLAGGGFMLPKAGVFAHVQARVVAERIAGDLLGRESRAAFDGRGACFLELGDGAAGYASGDFYAEDAPRVRMRRPGRHWHLAKVALERYFMRRWF